MSCSGEFVEKEPELIQIKPNIAQQLKKAKYGVNTYRERSKKKIGRHKKRLNKSQKPHKKYRGQGR